MGNICCISDCLRRGRHNTRWSNIPPATETTPPPPPPLIFAAATPSPKPNPNQFYQYPDHCPPPPPPYYHHHFPNPWIAGEKFPMVPPFIEHQKAVTIHNAVNLKKETLRLEPDPVNPGRFLVSFVFDASVSGRITVVFFAKEVEECNLIATKEDSLPSITFDFDKGLGQKFIQPSGTGIDLSVFKDSELFEEGETGAYPLAVKAEAAPVEGKLRWMNANAQITQVVYVKEKGEVKVGVVKQILCVNGMRYELQEIYGIGNTTVDGCDEDLSDMGKECVICLSEPRNIVVLPCRHMCMCSGCAKMSRFQTNLCPICRQPIERLLETQVNRNEENGDMCDSYF